MSSPSAKPSASCDRFTRKDAELCKVVFAAAISQILYSRRAFPPECFQALPLQRIVASSFEDIVSAGAGIAHHDRDLLRDEETTVFIRETTHYGVSRLLGIMKEDIFPLIVNETLVKFRINFLRTQTWRGDCLEEYYTVNIKYEHNGLHVLDVWRAGTGSPDAPTTPRQLGNLGDYLSRLPLCSDLLNWTLAFHSSERPEDPPIGIWKFDRTAFDDANLALQQRDGYSYARVARLRIMPLSLTDTEEIDSHDSLEPEPGGPSLQQSMMVTLKTNINQSRKKPKKMLKSNSNRRRIRTGARSRKTAGPQLSPPLTLGSNRNASQNNIMKEGGNNSSETGSSDNASPVSSNRAGKSVPHRSTVTRRKPKRPLQLIEYTAPPIDSRQMAAENQTSRGKPFNVKGDLTTPEHLEPMATQLDENEWPTITIPRSPSPNPFRLLGGISLSPEGLSTIQESSQIGLPLLPPPARRTSQEQSQETLIAVQDGSFRHRQQYGSSIILGGSSQQELHASPPTNFFGIDLSDQEENPGGSWEADHAVLSQARTEGNVDAEMMYDFSPNAVARRTSLFYGLPESSDVEL